MIHGEWTYSIDEETWTSDYLYDSKEAAALGGIAEHGDKDFWVGQIFTPDLNIDAEDVIRRVQDNMNIEFSEWAENYLDDVSTEHLDLLENKLREVLNDWARETGNEPTFFRVEHITLVTGRAS